MAIGFKIHEVAAAGGCPMKRVRTAASTQYQPGDMCKIAAGVLTQVAAGDKGTHIFVCIETPKDKVQQATENLSTAAQEMALCQEVSGNKAIIRNDLTGNSAPLFSGTACNANSDATKVVFTGAGSTNDNQNGTVYIPEIGEQRECTADSVAAGVHTLTVAPAFSRAPTTGDTLILVPFQRGMSAVKYNATAPQQGIGTAVADKTGGQLQIAEVHLEASTPFVLVSCPDME